MYTNFGELGDAVRDLVEQYSMKSKGNANIQSLGNFFACNFANGRNR